MDYLEYVNEKYPIRRSKSEKEDFRKYVLSKVESSKYDAYVETDKKSNNVIIGNINEAEVIFTAHYDTPAASIIPNILLPKNKVLRRLAWLLSIIVSVIICCKLDNLITKEFYEKRMLIEILILVLFVLLCYLLFFCFRNKHNKNDNTSGVATILSLVSECSAKNIAFVLFDNEERGKLGSKAFKKKHNGIIKDKLVINFDCVGVGNHVLFIAKESAMNHVLYDNLKKYIKINNSFDVEFCSSKDACSNSDYKNFECSISVMICEEKNDILYVDKIHTNKDVEAYSENINFLVDNMLKFIREGI